MKTLTSLALLALTGTHQTLAHNPNANCNAFADSCLSGLSGTGANVAPPRSSRLADCSSFQLVTVTPAPRLITTIVATVTVTVTTTTTTTNLAALVRRQVTEVPSSIPSYATQCCRSASDYASACSCLGVTGKTTTAPTPTSTVSLTATTTTTVTTTTTAFASFTCSIAFAECCTSVTTGGDQIVTGLGCDFNESFGPRACNTATPTALCCTALVFLPTPQSAILCNSPTPFP
ncbi:hypothetical protein BU23DRAFT_599763 [Bimuria novae-zelandiae CBS 107.79]|uniref:Hydrophobin n=1 Tax=Bimuria novae-zelandiae CBS 107.79 TaxID=1447943 RepID=A0A6A5V6J3_9PLEO|nr:hypothetical protein BU23DRAFT_599763 [Bimuria novae-zelandiae CBS 107.79]